MTAAGPDGQLAGVGSRAWVTEPSCVQATLALAAVAQRERSAWRRRSALLRSLLVLALFSAVAPQSAAQGPPASRLAACLILPSHTANIGSPLAGVVESVEVERGDPVARGDILVRLRADIERAQASVSRTRAESEAELRGAVAAEELALQRLDRSRALLGDRFLSQQAVDQAEAEYRLAVEKVSQARDALKVSAGESGVSRAQMAQRLIRAPFAGVITERFAQPGERYEEKPLLRIAAIDELKIEVVAPSPMFGQIQVGQIARIEPDLPGQSSRSARVVQIDQVLDPASNTFRIRLALDNRDRKLPAGLRCRADFTSPDVARRGSSATD